VSNPDDIAESGSATDRGPGAPARRLPKILAAGGLAITLMIAGYAAWRGTDSGEPAPVEPEPVAVDMSPPPEDWWTRPLELPGGYVLAGADVPRYFDATTGDRQSKALILNRATGRYIALTDYDAVLAAPRGDLAAVSNSDRPREIGVLDVPTGRVRWVRLPARPMAPPSWSPDGTRLLLTLRDKERGEEHLGVLDARAARLRTFLVGGPTAPESFSCTDSCVFTWMPDGTEVAYPQTDHFAQLSEARRHPRRGLQLFSADTGAPTRLLPVRGDVTGAYAWSPDGRHVVVQGQETPQLVKVATGEVIQDLAVADVYWAGNDRLVRLQGRKAIVSDLSGRIIERHPFPAELHDRYVVALGKP